MVFIGQKCQIVVAAERSLRCGSFPWKHITPQNDASGGQAGEVGEGARHQRAAPCTMRATFSSFSSTTAKNVSLGHRA